MFQILLLGLGRVVDAEDDCDSYYVCEDSNCTAVTCVTGYGDIITEDDAAPLWLILCGAQVFLMQLGFSNLEAGSVSRRNVQNIIFKNIMDACLGSIVWFCFGYGVAWGKGSAIGGSSFFEVKYDENDDWFFQWAFCVTASTIVSGAVAERMKLEAYFIYTIFITAFIYPVVVHWVWGGEGWASAFNENIPGPELPIIDFAGSGVVHMVGGWSGLMGAILVGPRTGRFAQVADAQDFTTHSIPLQAFGTFVLWFGWYGFNCGSTVAVYGSMGTASLVAVTTTLAAAAGGLTTSLVSRFYAKKWNIGLACNGILAGLVSITAPCSVVDPGYAIIIGMIGGFVYYGFSLLMITLKIDDPLDAAAVHGACGFWGVVSVAIFTTNENISRAGYLDFVAEIGVGTRLGYQICVALIITAWTMCLSGLMFYVAKITIGIRTEKGAEIGGLDQRDFKQQAYESQMIESVGIPTQADDKEVVNVIKEDDL